MTKSFGIVRTIFAASASTRAAISAAVNRTRTSLKAIFAGGNRVLAPFDLPFTKQP